MKLKIILFVVQILIYTLLIEAQSSDASLLNQYWAYKDRYMKHFTYIGKGAGQSIPVIKITREKQFVRDHTTTNGSDKEYIGKIEFGDAMVDQGLYLAAIAAEYRLLKNTGKDVTAILNELYYAIETINRLDRFAEEYYNSTPNLNGFFVRNDVPDGFYRIWEEYGDLKGERFDFG